MSTDDTICAISTAPGCGGIAVIRVSGMKAVPLCSRHLNTSIEEEPSHKACFRRFLLPDGQELDEVVCTLFRAPRSYTGEDTVEISCHGSPYIQNRIVQSLTDAGCRLARAGEFTQRAFLHGKMDLSQAEAVADLIAADSSAASRLALKQLRGGISNDLKELRLQLLHISSLLELELDFSEEDVTFASRSELQELALHIEERLTVLTNSFRTGNAIKNGIPVAIVGETNAGKSTLLNLLLHEEKAIVSDIHGTTRDSIEDTVTLQGVKFRFIDTAGLRETTDTVEQLGIGRTLQKIDEAAILLWVIDAPHLLSLVPADRSFQDLADTIFAHASEKKLLLLLNKTDLLSDDQIHRAEAMIAGFPAEHILLSAKHHRNTDLIEQKLPALAGLSDTCSESDTIVTNLRHYQALSAALTAIRRVRQAIADNLSGDLISIDLHDVLTHLGEVTGAITTDEVLASIFSRFCIGK